MTDRNIIELLPWYINNSLDEEENRIVAEALEKDNELKKEYELLKSLSTAIKSEEIQTPGEMGFARLKRSIKATDKSKALTPQTGSNVSRWKFAAIAASLLLVAQASFMLNQTDEQQYYRPLGSDTKVQDTILITFSPGVTEQQVRDTLLESQAVIIDGPSAAGIYRVRSSAQNRNITIQKLKSYKAIISHVQAD